MIVFDDVHLLHPGLVDSILPYMDNVEKVEGVDYRDATFILLSSSGSFGLIDIAEQEHAKVNFFPLEQGHVFLVANFSFSCRCRDHFL